MKKIIYLLLILFSSNLAFGQVTIWQEDFESYANGTGTAGPGGVATDQGDYPANVTKWTLDTSDHEFNTSGDFIITQSFFSSQRLAVHDTEGFASSNNNINGVVFWNSEEINISNFTNVSIEMEIRNSGDLDFVSGSAFGDYYRCQYELDNSGTWTTFAINGSRDGDFSNPRMASQTGLSGSTLKFRIEARNNLSSEYHYFDDIIVKGDCKETTTWSGSWSNLAPDSTKAAIFSANYTTSGTSITACSCTIDAGVTFTVQANDYLDIITDIDNSGTVVVENQGSIVQQNENSKITGTNFEIKKTTSTYVEYDFTYWSSPIETADIATVFDMSRADRIFDFTTANFNDANNNTHDDNNDDWNGASGTMTKGKGYIVEGEGAVDPFHGAPFATGLSQSVSFDGKINNGIITYGVTLDANSGDAFDNQNLIGNPYPSAIDIKKLQAANPGVLTGTYYFWTHGTPIASGTAGTDTDAYNFSNVDYATATTTGVGSNFNSTSSTGTVGKSAPEFIASGQGFFADVTAAGNVTYNNDMRVTGNNNQFRNTNTVYDRVWLNMTNDNGMFRQILVGFFDTATNAHDNGIDGKRLLNGNEFDFYSLLNTTKYAIQGFPILANEKIVPLGFEAPTTGMITISIDRLEGDLANVNIYLKDNLLNSLHDLKIAGFNLDITQAGEFNDRYELVFSRSALAVNNEVFSTSDLIVANLNNDIHFEMRNGTTINNVQVFDIIGKLVLQANPKSNNFNLQTNVNNGTVLFIKVQLENGQVLTKKFVKL